jgi:phage shock protein PspC (stress-responsive transcriptional regulator)
MNFELQNWVKFDSHPFSCQSYLPQTVPGAQIKNSNVQRTPTNRLSKRAALAIVLGSIMKRYSIDETFAFVIWMVFGFIAAAIKTYIAVIIIFSYPFILTDLCSTIHF